MQAVPRCIILIILNDFTDFQLQIYINYITIVALCIVSHVALCDCWLFILIKLLYFCYGLRWMFFLFTLRYFKYMSREVPVFWLRYLSSLIGIETHYIIKGGIPQNDHSSKFFLFMFGVFRYNFLFNFYFENFSRWIWRWRTAILSTTCFFTKKTQCIPYMF